jgi:hypothetical protein
MGSHIGTMIKNHETGELQPAPPGFNPRKPVWPKGCSPEDAKKAAAPKPADKTKETPKSGVESED